MKKKICGRFKVLLALILVITMLLLPLDAFAVGIVNNGATPDEAQPIENTELTESTEPTEDTEPTDNTKLPKLGKADLSATGASALSGGGSQEDPYIIATSDDWDALSASINSGSTQYSGKYFLMTDDISVTTVLGNRPDSSTDSNDNYFSGTFDGGGHELNVDINESGFGAAPFAIAHNATIKNLHVTGTVSSGANHATGLVAASKGRSIYDASYLTIRNVTVSTDISCPSHVAGIVGHAHSATITMENVVFDGSMSASSVQGGMIGWGGLGNGAKYSASFKDCLFAGTYNTNAAFYPVAFANNQGTATLINDFYTTSFGSGGSPIAPTGDGLLKLLVATVEKDGAVNYFDNINTAADGSNWTQGSTLKLMTDVTTGSTITVPTGEHTLDLNGHGIKMTGSDSVFTVRGGAKLIINDSNPDKEHRFSLSNAQSNGAGLATVNDSLTSGYQTFKGGYITGGKGNTRSSWREGGAIYIEGEVEMNAGTLIGNGTYGSSHGGGFETRESGRFVMNGGCIQNNAALCGGACRLVGGSAEFAGGKIINNVVSNDGGGIHVGGTIPLVLKDCEISGNYANGGPGAGVWMSNDGTTVSGKTVIKENYVGTREDNIEIPSNRVLYVGELTDGASIGITMQSGPAAFTSGWNDNMGDADPSKYFTSDNDTYDVFLNKNGEAEIGEYVPFDGSGTEEDPFLLQSADDWDTLADSVLAGKTYDNKFFLLKEDITAERGIGSADITSATAPVYAFSGIFDGGGHTLDFVPPANANANYVAPFSIVKNATIRNLKVTGKITAYNNLSGLVGATRGTLTIENVLSDVDVTGNFVGGFIGHGTSGDITLRSCAFTGDLNGTTLAGGLICWRGPTQWDSSSTSAVHMENCLFAGTASGSADFHPIGFTQQTNVSQGFSNMWSTLGGKNNGKGFYNYQYQSASYKSTAATVTSGKSSSRPWMGYYDVIECLPVESTFTDAVNAWTDGSILALLTDVTTSSSITVPAGEHTLDLNGHGILMTGNARVLTINQNASLELNDSDPDRIHYITLTDYRGTAVSDSGEASVSNGNGVIQVTGGYLTGGYINNSGSHDKCGAGVFNWGTFVMNGGSIVGNTIQNNSGAGVRNSGTFTMNDGTIAFNKATGNGGGVTTYVPGGGQGKMTMTGGAISDNYCGSYGGGIQLAGPFELTGGSVIRNTAGAGGSGIYYGGQGEKFKLSGDPVIKDNINNNLYLNADATFMINDSLTEDAEIGVTMNKNAAFTVGWKDKMGGADPSKYFTSDDSNYEVILNNSGELEIGLPPVASIISGETTTNYGSLSAAVNAWSDGSTLKLLTDVTTSSTVTVPSGEHILDLNGHGIRMTGWGSVFYVGDGAKMIINDSDTDATHRFEVPDGAGLASLNEASGTYTVSGGYITGGNADNGGGIYIAEYGEAVMNGGALIGNHAEDNGAGIRMESNTSFTLNGGEIAYNQASVHGGGLGLAYTNHTTITINDGAIHHNICECAGGAVTLDNDPDSYLYLYGGVISDNASVSGSGNNPWHPGGIAGNANIHVKGAPQVCNNINLSSSNIGASNHNIEINTSENDFITLDGPLSEGARIAVSYHTSGSKTTGVFTSGWNTYMGNAEPAEYFVSDYDEYIVSLSGGEAAVSLPPVASIISGGTTTNYNVISDAVNAWTAGSTLRLLADVTTNSTITVPSGEHTLDLNGHGIKMTGNASAFTVSSGAKLIINDSNADTEHKFTLTNAQLNGAGLATVNDSLTSGYKTFNGGYITGGKGNSRSSWREGGAIYIEGEVEMYAGTLIGNGIHGTTHGGGFVTRENGRFVMHGGSIQNNAGLCGGACRLVGGSAEIDGGTIINNIVTNDGGAIHVGGTIPLVLKDCEISGNYAGGGPGAGIWMSNDGTTVSGKTLIKDNYVGSRQDNIEIPSGRVLYIGELTDGTSIGITMQSDTGVFTSGWKDKMGDADPSKYFTSDNDDYIVDLDDSGEACLRYPDVPDVSAEGYEGGYDGAAHGITVSIPDGAEVKYGTQEGSYTLTDNPTYTDAGTYTIYYEASMEKYTSVYGSAVVQIDPIDVTVTVTGHNDTADYDGKAHSIEGYDAAASSDLYDVTKDFTFSGTAKAERTDAGTTAMGLTASQFANTNDNFATVTFNVTDGYITIDPIDVTVTVTGHNDTADYDGKAHAVTGYDVEFSSTLYAEEYFTFSGEAKAERTDAGTANMGLSADQFSNTNDNFATVTFNVTDGYITIDPIDVTVTVTGHNSTVDYDGKAHSVTGYDVEFSSTLYAEEYFTFSGEAKAERTVAGTSVMGLSADQFSNNNDNFANVTFDVTDGTISIRTINVTVTVIGHSTTADYDGELHSISGYDAYATSDLYDVAKDFTFSGTAKAERTDAGTTEMGLSADQFANTNTNFSGVTFIVTDGYVTIDPIDVTVTVTGHNSTVDYDGKAHTVTGYDVEFSTPLYTEADFTFSGEAKAERTVAGTVKMGLTASQFANINDNFATVTFNVTDGYITVAPIDVTVTIVGDITTADYDGDTHIAYEYVATADTELYNVEKDFTFISTAYAERVDAGVTYMGMKPEHFENTNDNFADVTFIVTDGYVRIDPISTTVTITGSNGTAVYDGTAHIVSGYDAAADSDLYDVAKDFAFTGTDHAEQTDAGTAYMGLAPEQFSNINPNFTDVAFIVTDGYQTVTRADAVITTAPYAKSKLVYTGASQQLVMPGSVTGGTLYYALGTDGSTAPAASRYSTKIPTASQIGNYYIWYKVVADTNHNSIAPAYLKITLAEPEWMTIKGTITLGDGSAASGDVTVTLMSGSTVVDTIVTDADGGYYFTVPAGVYNIVVTSGDVTQTVMVDITEGTVRDITLSDANTKSVLDVVSSDKSIVVGGLDEEAAFIRSSEGLSSDRSVTVRMTVATVSAGDTIGSAVISDYAEDRYLEYYDMKVEKTVDSVTTTLSETQNVLEVAIPFSYTAKRDLTVYRYDGSGVQELTESDTRAAGTYRVDYEAGLVYIYSNRFMTYAISYKPYFRVNSLLMLGGFSGSVSVKLTKDTTGETYALNNVSLSNISFSGLPKGTYSMTITWTDGAENTLTTPFIIK